MNAPLAGERFGFQRLQGSSELPEAWRDLDRAVWRWVLAHGGDAVTALCAGWASHAEGQGHTALPLSGSEIHPALADEALATLKASPLVADAGALPAQPPPFVLDREHLYLLRNYRAEVAVAGELAARRALATPAVAPLSDEDLSELFNRSWRDAEAHQRAAVRQAPGKRLMVLTGGPGTGKTTTVLRMLLGLSREHRARTGHLPQLRIAAPTGKAAQRLGESLRQEAEHLSTGENALGEHWRPHLDAALATDAATVHRLLGSRGRGGYSFHADEPLPADIVVVDEASMLDLGLLRALLAALRQDAVLVLVGDADQLTSVGTGSIMLDIVEALERDPRDDLVRLRHCFRADATLVPINEAVRSGDPAAFETAIKIAASRVAANGQPAASVHRVDDAGRLRHRLADWAGALQAILAEARITVPLALDDPALPERLRALRCRQLLCALREGPFGARQAAAAIATQLRAWDDLAPWDGAHWYPGRSIIITRNDHAARLYNGDVGLCVPVRDETGETLLRVIFEPAAESTGTGQGAPAARVRLFDPATLPPHEDAFALTVHKSQGSEYAHVAVLLPPDPDSPLLVRQTLYTGLSRARHSLELWSTPASTGRALATVLRRHGRLAARIAD